MYLCSDEDGGGNRHRHRHGREGSVLERRIEELERVCFYVRRQDEAVSYGDTNVCIVFSHYILYTLG